MEVGPHLARLESEWVGAVKKNLEIDGQCMRLESECVSHAAGATEEEEETTQHPPPGASSAMAALSAVAHPPE